MSRKGRAAEEATSASSSSVRARSPSRETTPISSSDESASSSCRGYRRNSSAYGAPFDPWYPYQWAWNPMLAMQQWQHQMSQPQPGFPPNVGVAASTGSSANSAPVFIPPRGKRPRDAPSKKGKDPAPKRRRSQQNEAGQSTADLSDSSAGSDLDEDNDGDLAEAFDPLSLYNTSSNAPLPEALDSFVKSHFRKCLTSSIRKSMAKDDPLPDHPCLKCLQADDSIVDFLGKDFPVKLDNQLKRIQSAILTAAAPSLNLWKELHEQDCISSADCLIPVSTALEAIQKSLVLMGNASNYVSLIRRDHIISKMDLKNKSLAKVMKSICKHHQPDDSQLFGAEVHKALNERAETASSLRKVATKFSDSTPRAFEPGRRNKFFRGGLAPDRDRKPGKTFRSQKPKFQNYRNKTKTNWSKNTKN